MLQEVLWIRLRSKNCWLDLGQWINIPNDGNTEITFYDEKINKFNYYFWTYQSISIILCVVGQAVE